MFWRNFITLLRRYTASSLLNIVGMAIAFAAAYLILVQVHYDLRYNQSIPDVEHIYRLEYPSWTTEGNYAMTWNRLLPQAMCEACPEVEQCANIFTQIIGRQYFSIKRNLQIDNFELAISRTDEKALQLFSFEFIDGSAENIGVHDLVMAESCARRYNLKVGDRLHIGQGADERNVAFPIIGIYRDQPRPGDLAEIDCFAGFPEINYQQEESSWSYPCYVKLAEGAEPIAVTAKLDKWLRDSMKEEGASESEVEEQMKLLAPRLNPYSRLYFATECEGAYTAQGNKTTTLTLIAIAVLILGISFINFVNFFFALIPVRIRAVNTLKIFGAPTTQLRLNFLFETLGLILISLFGAAVIVVLVGDTPLTEYISTSIAIEDNWSVALSLAGVALMLGLVVSLYPAWYITKFSPAFVLGGSFHATRQGRILRYVLVCAQYVISLSLIIAVIFMERQQRFMMNYDMGFNRELVYTVAVDEDYTVPTRDKLEALFDKLKQNPMVEDVTAADAPMVAPMHGGWGVNMPDGRFVTISALYVYWNFLDFMGIELTEGRNLSSSDTDAMIMNETGRKAIDLQLDRASSYAGSLTSLVGFCKDWHSRSLQFTTPTMCFVIDNEVTPSYLYVRMAKGTPSSEARNYIRTTLAEFNPAISADTYTIRTMDEDIERLYQSEQKLTTLITLFALISIIISLMGVFGLVLFDTQYRRKEIGIRRVNGATVTEILLMFNLQFLKIVAVCAVVAIPLGYYAINRWLSNFAYRISLDWWVFVLAILILALLTVGIVTLRSWKAATENPADVVKNN